MGVLPDRKLQFLLLRERARPSQNMFQRSLNRSCPVSEQFLEYGLQRRANIAIYNNFDELRQSNIGLSLDWQTTGGITKLVNNKMIVYFDGNHETPS